MSLALSLSLSLRLYLLDYPRCHARCTSPPISPYGHARLMVAPIQTNVPTLVALSTLHSLSTVHPFARGATLARVLTCASAHAYATRTRGHKLVLVHRRSASHKSVCERLIADSVHRGVGTSPPPPFAGRAASSGPYASNVRLMALLCREDGQQGQ